MDFMQTNAKHYVVIKQHCVTKIIAIAEPGGFRIYVAWEWKDCAEKGLFGFTKSRELHVLVSEENIYQTMTSGFDIGGMPECNEVFKDILKK